MGLEQRPDQQHQEPQPEEEAHSRGEQQAQAERQRYVDSVMGYIKRKRAEGGILFEVALDRIGLSDGLEEIGIVTNPFEKRGRQFERGLERQEQILADMETGAILQYYFPPLATRLVPEEQLQAEEAQQNLGGQCKAALFSKLRNGDAMLAGEVAFERALERQGLRQQLSEIGIWPIVTNPNPYAREVEETVGQSGGSLIDALEENEQVQLWWNKHLEESEQFSRVVQRDIDARKHMYIGALIARNFPELFHELKATEANPPTDE